MKEETQSRIDFYLEVFKDFKCEVGDGAVAAMLVEQVAKDQRIQAMRSESVPTFTSGVKSVVHGDDPASSAQLAYLKRLGVALPTGVPLTKALASTMLDQALAGR